MFEAYFDAYEMAMAAAWAGVSPDDLEGILTRAETLPAILKELQGYKLFVLTPRLTSLLA